MSDHPWYKHYTKDWLGDPELRLCSPAARGLLEDLMCTCHEGDPYGYLKRADGSDWSEADLCKILHYRPAEYRKLLAELKERTRLKEDDIGLYVPRLVKERQTLEFFRECGANGGNPELKKPKKPRRPKTKPGSGFDYTPEYDAFWSVYPRQQGKRAAFEFWLDAIAAGIDPVLMITAAKDYAAEVDTAKTELKFVKLPKNWLDEGCWDDVLDSKKSKLRQAEKRHAAEKKKSEKIMGEFVDFVKEWKPTGDGDDTLERMEKEVSRRLGAKAVPVFLKRIAPYLRDRGAA